MTRTILYVEDNAQNMRLVAKILRNAGYTLLEASTGLDGLELAAREQPDLILMDINLPDIDGIEAVKRLKSTPVLQSIPVIALTANAMYGDREHYIASGCDGYLAKPIARMELLKTVEHFLNAPRENFTNV